MKTRVISNLSGYTLWPRYGRQFEIKNCPPKLAGLCNQGSVHFTCQSDSNRLCVLKVANDEKLHGIMLKSSGSAHQWHYDTGNHAVDRTEVQVSVIDEYDLVKICIAENTARNIEAYNEPGDL